MRLGTRAGRENASSERTLRCGSALACSLLRRRPRRTFSWRWLVVGGYAAGLFALSSAPVSRRLVAAQKRLVRGQCGALPRWLPSDKVFHALVFGLGTVLLCRALHDQTPARTPRQIAFYSVLAALGYGITDELHQARVPQRTAEVADVMADGLGAALAAWGWLHSTPRWTRLR